MLNAAELNEKTLTPDTPIELITDLSRSPRLKPLLNRLVEKAQVQAALAMMRQHRINEANSRLEHRFVEGMGEKVATIDLEIYFRMRQIYGHDCWFDPDFVVAFLRDNPDCRITNYHKPARIMVDGFRDRAKHTRSTVPQV